MVREIRSKILGKFHVENDTLVRTPLQQDKQHDEDVNNKMFIVVRNLKSSSTKNVRSRLS